MDYLDVCERFVVSQFPTAIIAVVGGSTARGTRTPTSDIDLLLIGNELFTDGRSSLAASCEFEGEIFEVFAYTLDTFDEWARKGVAQHRPVIVHMLVEGAELRGGTELESLRTKWREVLSAGPRISQRDLDMRRYTITDLLDDLQDATDSLERYVLSSTLFEKTAELMLLSGNRWIGTAKYLPRRLREMNVERADTLSEPLLRGDLASFAACVEYELELAGGRIQTGFVR